MATYKVIQDIEAEDKLVGPLSLRQFIYAGIAAVCIYLSAMAVMKGASFMLVILLPPALFTGFLAFPWGRDQPTEVWLLAKIRFYTKPKVRVWNQSGVKDLVTITAPKVAVKRYTNGLSEYEVRHRLNTLARTVDSRGWAAKNVDTSPFNPAVVTTQTPPASDRLIDPSSMPKEVPVINPADGEDMLDEQNSPLYHHFDTMLTESSKNRRQKLIDDLKKQIEDKPAIDVTAQPAIPANPAEQSRPEDYWFMNEQAASHKTLDNQVVFATQVITPGSGSDTPDPVAAVANPVPDEPTADEEEIIAKKLKEKQEQAKQTSSKMHMKTILPPEEIAAEEKRIAEEKAKQAEQEREARAKVAEAEKVRGAGKENHLTNMLAGNNDLSIATISRIANKQDEVVVQIH